MNRLFPSPAILCFFLFLVFACSSPDSEIIAQDASIHEDTLEIEESIAEIGVFTSNIEVTGKIHSEKEQTILAPTSGIIKEINVLPNKTYPKHYASLVLDTEEIEHSLKYKQIDSFNASKVYESNLAGYENLLKNLSVSEKNIILKKLRISSGLSSFELDIQSIKRNLYNSTIRLPFQGVIANVISQQGQLVKSGDPLFLLYDAKHLIAEVNVLESDILDCHYGMKALVYPISSEKSVCSGTMAEINPVVDKNGMIQVKIKIAESKNSKILLPGMNCIVKMIVSKGDALLVLKEAIVRRDNKQIVFTHENGLAKWNEVITGRENDTFIEIRSGLRKKDKVIVTNNLHLSDGMPIKVKPAIQ